VLVGGARLRTCCVAASRAFYSCGLAALLILFGARVLQNAVAEGDTRTVTLHHIHTDEDITITFKRDGRYDEAALEKLNWFLRDWRKEQETRMDPHLIDLVWEVQREAGSKTADLGRLRLSLAGNQRHASSPQRRRRAFFRAHARPRHGFLHSRRAARTTARHRLAPATRRCRLLSDLRLAVRAHGYRRRAACGRACRANNWSAYSPTAVPSTFRATAARSRAMRWRWPISAPAAAPPSELLLEQARNAGVQVADAGVASHRANPIAKFLGLAHDDEDEDVGAPMPAATAANAPPAAARAAAHACESRNGRRHRSRRGQTRGGKSHAG
jgi:hypothetical protein